jgi:hypothetical protein
LNRPPEKKAAAKGQPQQPVPDEFELIVEHLLALPRGPARAPGKRAAPATAAPANPGFC